MQYGLLHLATLFSFVCAVLLLVWAIRWFGKEKNELIVPSLLFGVITLIISLFSFHYVSFEQGKAALQKALVEEIQNQNN